MELGVWIIFAMACLVLSVIPGPSVLVAVTQAITNGTRAALICIAGDMLGGVCLMTLSIMGAGAVIAASPMGFEFLKWMGVIYLLYLGISGIWPMSHSPAAPKLASQPSKGSFKVGFLTEIFNPKSLIFYMAFFNQFVDVMAPLEGQYLLLMLTAVGIGGLVLSGYAIGAQHFKRLISSSATQTKFTGLSGVLYIAGAGFLAITR